MFEGALGQWSAITLTCFQKCHDSSSNGVEKQSTITINQKAVPYFYE